MKTEQTVHHVNPVMKAYVPTLATRINALRAAAAQPSVITIGNTGLRYAHSMGGNEGSRL